jgi:type I restriction enzyme R subunit
VSEVAERTVQNGICKRLAELGWSLTLEDESLGRPVDEVVRFDEFESALVRLNPEIAARPQRAQEVLARLRAVLLSAPNDGLVAANEELVAWMCNRRTHKFVGADKHSQVRLIDFENVRSNVLRVTTEATFHAGREHRRYDIVLWVNGLPLVVGEVKAPTAGLSWLNAATDIHNGYEVKTPGFFVSNVLSFATDGREFRYGAVRQPPELWLNWGSTTDEMMQPGLPAVMRAAELLLSPEMILDILRHYTLYSARRTSQGAVRQKVIPRYPQVEAVDAIVQRCLDPVKRQGLVWHHQGSGKTFAMAYAAAKLRHITQMDAPTIVIVLDRLDLIEQTASEFASVGIPTTRVAATKDELRTMLAEDARGVIITTIFRFKDAGFLNDRTNIVVMVDEAHRTQEGRLGLDMREALPNAKFIGLTGTPIATDDRNTWAMFGDPDDPDGALNHYSVERSISDGATLPVHVETRLVDFHVNAEALQSAFDDLAAEEDLDDHQQAYLTKKAAHLSVVVRDPDRIAAVCADIVNHYRERIAPLGLKAQIVAFDRATCVAYYDELQKHLRADEQATVVMTTAKDDPQEWSVWDLDREQEAVVKDRFRDIDDPLKFLIVTAKLLTGFDAPIEGVMYLDKPLRAHTLFQAVCRTNRRWSHPRTGQQKLHGLVVDYVGLGQDLAKAVAVRSPEPGKPQLETDVDVLLGELADAITIAAARFTAIGRNKPIFEQLFEAQEILESAAAREEFAAEFIRCEGLFEFLYPSLKLKPHEADYRLLAKIYASIQPSKSADLLLWHRLGAKTMALVHEHLDGVTVDGSALDQVALDAATLEYLQDNQLVLLPVPHVLSAPPTAAEVLERLEERIRRRMEGTDPHRVWKSLVERLEALRALKIASAEASVEFLKHLLEVAKDLVRAERADDEGSLDEIRVLDPRRGALTQIFEEYSPEERPVAIEQIVDEVDALVAPIRGTGWQSSHPGDQAVRRELRLALAKFSLPPTGDLFDRAYAYIRENY